MTSSSPSPGSASPRPRTLTCSSNMDRNSRHVHRSSMRSTVLTCAVDARGSSSRSFCPPFWRERTVGGQSKPAPRSSRGPNVQENPWDPTDHPTPSPVHWACWSLQNTAPYMPNDCAEPGAGSQIGAAANEHSARNQTSIRAASTDPDQAGIGDPLGCPEALDGQRE